MEQRLEEQLKESYSLWNGTNELYSRWAKSQGLTYDALFVLYAIQDSQDGCCQKEICEKWSMPKQTVNSILKNFEKEGYLLFTVDENDKRNKIIRFSERGRAYAGEILGRLHEIESRVVRKIGSDDMEAYLAGGRLFYQYFQEESRGL